MSLEEILTRAEGKTLEFKRDVSSSSRNLVKTLVAFANTAGGKVIIGVDDQSRSPVGIAAPLDEEERICNLIADSIQPRLVPNIELFTVAEKTLLVIEVFLSGNRPHWVKAEGPEDGVYVRLGSSNRRADRELIAELRRSVEGVAYDELPMPDLSMEDLDMAAIKESFRDQRDIGERELLTLRVLTTEQGRLVPTRGGILLFGKDRRRHFPDAWIQCGRFVGRDKAVIFDHVELHAHPPTAVEDIMLFLKKHAMRGADFSGIQRRDVWSIPLGILREAVINALVHADYSQRGAPIRVAFFDDRIEIENPGILLPGMTIEDMRRGVSRIRNHVIARVFRELKLIEQWGSGVSRMFREAGERGLPPPEILEMGMRLRFTVRLGTENSPREMTERAHPSPDGQSTEQVAEQAREQVAEQAREQVTEQVRPILVCLENGPLGGRDLMEKLALRHRPTFLYRYLRPAMDAGLIEMTQPESPNSPTQRYRLTSTGEQVIRG